MEGCGLTMSSGVCLETVRSKRGSPEEKISDFSFCTRIENFCYHRYEILRIREGFHGSRTAHEEHRTITNVISSHLTSAE
jgi:hypothetical protein